MSLKQIAIAALGKDSVTGITLAGNRLTIVEGNTDAVVEQAGKEFSIFLKAGKTQHKTVAKAIAALSLTATSAAAKSKDKQPATPAETTPAGDASTTDKNNG
jgi:hypothetical protein